MDALFFYPSCTPCNLDLKEERSRDKPDPRAEQRRTVPTIYAGTAGCGQTATDPAVVVRSSSSSSLALSGLYSAKPRCTALPVPATWPSIATAPADVETPKSTALKCDMRDATDECVDERRRLMMKREINTVWMLLVCNTQVSSSSSQPGQS